MCDQKFKFCENQPTDVNYPNLSDAEAGNDIKSVKKLSPLTAKKNQTKVKRKSMLFVDNLTLVILILIVNPVHLTRQTTVKL